MYYGTDDGGFSIELIIFMILLLALTAVIYRRKDIRRWLGALERKFLERVQNWWWSRDERREKREFKKASQSEAAVAARKRMREPVRRPVKINALGFLDDEEMAEFAEKAANELAADSVKETAVEATVGTAAEGTEAANPTETSKAASKAAVSHSPAAPGKWRCKCGRMNDGSTSECECGLFKSASEGTFFSFLKKKTKKPKVPEVPLAIPEPGESVADKQTRWEQIQARKQKELASQMGAYSAPVKEPDTEEDADAILEDELSEVRINLEESMKGLR